MVFESFPLVCGFMVGDNSCGFQRFIHKNDWIFGGYPQHELLPIKKAHLEWTLVFAIETSLKTDFEPIQCSTQRKSSPFIIDIMVSFSQAFSSPFLGLFRTVSIDLFGKFR